MNNIAVIISVYKSDIKDNVKFAIDSVLEQSVNDCSIDIFLQVDGPVEISLQELLVGYNIRGDVFVEFVEVNHGLAWQLNRAISRVSTSDKKYDYLARMDADDISDLSRFQKQVDYFTLNDGIAVLGSDMIEFYSSGYTTYKSMDSDFDTMKSKIIKKCPVNHPSVMFNLRVLPLSQIVYNDKLKNTQDYYLWIDLIAQGFVFANINEPLLKFRVDDNFNERRGVRKLRNDVCARLYALNKLGIHSVGNYLIILALVLFRLSPKFVRIAAYKYLR